MRNKRTKSVFFFIFPGYIFITLAALIATAVVAYNALTRLSLETVRQNLSDHASFIQNVMQQDDSWQAVEPIATQLKKDMGLRVTLVDSAGVVLFDTDSDAGEMDNHKYRDEIEQSRVSGEGFAIRYSNTVNRKMLYVAIVCTHPSMLHGTIRTAMPLMVWRETIWRIRGPLVSGLMIIGALAILISFTVSRRIISQLQLLRNGAEAYAEQVTHESLPDFPWWEFQSVAESLHQMAVQLHDKIQEAVIQKNEREAILGSLTQALVAVNSQNRILWHNSRFDNLFQEECRRSVKGARLLDVLRSSQLADLIEYLQEGGEPQSREITLDRRNDDTLVLNVRAARMINKRGEHSGAVFTFIDVTRLHKLEAMRQDFVANVSHELRTPITSMQGAVETLEDLIEDEATIEEMKPFIAMIHRHSERMNAIINDLLTLSRLDTENADELSKDSCDLRVTIAQAVDSVHALITERNMSVVIEIPDGIVVEISEGLFEQAVLNLLTNALRYSEQGRTVTIGVAQNALELGFFIKDQGWGMEQKHLTRIFERFYRVDKARTRALGGTGLGLCITRHIILLHRGTLQVESNLGEGSCFTVLLPKNT